MGDLLEAMSGGRYPATRHRVRVPEEEIRRRTRRQSIVFFVHPDDEVGIGIGIGNENLLYAQVVCSPLTGPDPCYPPVTARQHLENRFAATYGDRIQ